MTPHAGRPSRVHRQLGADMQLAHHPRRKPVVRQPGPVARCEIAVLVGRAAAAVCLSLVVVAQAEAGAARGRPLRTGQSGCWDSAGTSIACDGTGHDGDLRRGLSRVYVDNGDGTITDQKTALMWEKISDDDSIHDQDDLYTWADAFAVKLVELNSGAGFAGYTDWRLPSLFELHSIINLGTVEPAVSEAFNTACSAGCTVLTCSCTGFGSYWSSSSHIFDQDEAWRILFSHGFSSGGRKTNLYRVRAVRGGA